MSAATVPKNDSRSISIRMNSSRQSSLFVVVIITGSSSASSYGPQSIGDFKPGKIYELWMGLIASDRDDPCPGWLCRSTCQFISPTMLSFG